MMKDIGKYRLDLDDRVICGDGDSIAGLPFLYDRLLTSGKHDGIYVSKADAETDEVRFHNKKFPRERIEYKRKLNPTSLDWVIPEKFKSFDLDAFMKRKLKAEFGEFTFSDEEKKKRVLRVKMELRIWRERGLEDLLRTLIYIVHKLEENKIVWGTGRGSSCASYILYLVGIHQVDSVEYDLDIGEFFR